MSVSPDEFADIYRREVGRCTATLIRVLGDVDLAEDAVADAFAVAADHWGRDGLPDNPGGWITTTARNRAIDRLRRESGRRQREQAAVITNRVDDVVGGATLGELDVVPDDQLRLMFLCCHPALSIDAQVALVLRLVSGLTTGEIAQAFLVPEQTIGQRISRAKRKIRDTHMAYRLPGDDEVEARLAGVLGATYLVFTEGHTASRGGSLRRAELSREAIRLTRVIVELAPEAREALGLLALMLLTEARSPARTDAVGELVRLADQDRSLWDRDLIAEGHGIVRSCVEHNEPGPYQIQAAIAAVHADARDAATTDWAQIALLYDHLIAFRPDPVVALNRAIAVMEASGPGPAIAELDRLSLESYHLFHATRAEALHRLGRDVAARTALRRAIDLAANEVERAHLERRLASLH